MTGSSRATQRSHFAHYRAQLAFSIPWQATIRGDTGRPGSEALEARRLYLRQTLLGPHHASGVAQVPR